jgi:4-coumarate--CoA ligase
VHGIDRLEQEARALAVLFPERRRVLAAVPGHHIYGFLFTHLLPRHLGLGSARVEDVRVRVPATLAHRMAPGDLVIGHPSFWQAALAGELDFPQDVIGVSSTAPCPDEIAAAAERRGLARLVQVYGSSETAGIGWRASHREDYSLLPYLDRAGAHEPGLVRTLPDGRHATVQPPDSLSWSGPRTFALRGRDDGVVQVGGVNVHPEHVRATLLDYPGIADCAVRLMRPDEGERLKAFIIRAPADTSTDRDFVHRLRAWIDSRLPVPERPKAFTIGTQLPRTAMGKPADWLIG